MPSVITTNSFKFFFKVNYLILNIFKSPKDYYIFNTIITPSRRQREAI